MNAIARVRFLDCTNCGQYHDGEAEVRTTNLDGCIETTEIDDFQCPKCGHIQEIEIDITVRYK